jgi:hypothetical protein
MRLIRWCADWIGWFFTGLGDRYFNLYDVPLSDEGAWKWYDHCWFAIGNVPIRIGSWFYNHGPEDIWFYED